MVKEFCNPLNIDYKYQHLDKFAYREAADPTMIYFKNKYYLFASMSAGFYYSDDLVNWKWHENRELDIYHYAPDVRQIGEYLFFCSSNLVEPSTIWRTEDPLSDKFEKVSEPFPFWDPNLFCDDDGRVYLFYGCSNSEPLYGVELERDTMQPIGAPVEVAWFDIKKYGFERYCYPGKEVDVSGTVIENTPELQMINEMFENMGTPFFEGSYVNKFGEKYYLQYAAPSASLPVYGDGVAVSDSPLGPYKTCHYTPFSFKPKGFINGAGHGSTIEDSYGNLWHASTMRIYVNAGFERRVGLWPAGLDKDGYLYCNQNFGDYPMVIPEGKFDPKEILPHYMLLSYKKSAKASSVLKNHPVELAMNEDVRTWWSAEGNRDEWFEMDLGEIYKVHSIQLNFADEKILSKVYPADQCCTSKEPASVGRRYVESGLEHRTKYIMEGSVDGNTWFILKDAAHAETNLPHDYIVFEKDRDLRFVKVSCIEIPHNGKFAISGLRVFGKGDSIKPMQVVKSEVQREEDELSAVIQWQTISNTMGYNIRIGVRPDKLYQSYQIYGDNSVTVTSLNQGVEYWYCIDSYNESGITEGIVKRME